MAQNPINSIKLFGKKFNIVSEADQRDRNNTLYLYARIINKITYVKFGEAFDQSIWDRYNGTGCSQHSEMIHVWQSAVRDTPIHEVLKTQFKWAGKSNENPMHSKEVYIMHSAAEIKAFIKAVTDIVTQNKIGPDFYRDRCGEPALVPRTYQANMINSAVSILDKSNRVLLNVSTRAGKSYISLKTCKELGAKNILILTPFPKAEDSFRKLGERNMEFSGYKYTHLNAKTDKVSLCDKNIIFCSYQFYDVNKRAVKDTLSSMYFDVVVLDECHHTADSARTTNIILNNVKYNKMVYMSGTPFNNIISGYFDKNEVVTFDFVDFIKYSISHPNEISLPKLYVKTIDNLMFLQNKMCSLDNDIFSKADAFDYSVVFSNELHAESFFKWLFQPVETQGYIINKQRWFDLNKQKHIIAFFNSNEEVQIAKKALDRVWPYGSKTVVQISGDDANKEYIDCNEQKINDLFDNNDRTLILTCGKLTTGVTLPKLDTVWYFKNSSSAEQFIQILFRTMTPCKGKDEVSMFCFDTEATLKVVKKYAAIRQDPNSLAVTRDEDRDTVRTIIADILSCFNFMYLDDNLEFVSETVDSYFTKVHNLPFSHVVVNSIKNYNAFNGISDLGTEEISDRDLIVVQPKGEAIRGNCDINKSIKKLFSRGSKDTDAHSIPEITKKVIRQIAKILNDADKHIFVEDKIKTYKDLESLWPSNLGKYKNNFIQLLADNKVWLNQMIEDIRYKAENDPKGFLLGLSNSNSTDMKTPDSLLEKMFSKMSNVKGIICDPCCGCGSIFEYVHNKYGISKECLYGIELELINVKMCHKLGYYNIIQGDASDPKTWEVLIKLLNRNTDKMKFDHIIMNPPYCKNLHLKILNEAICYSDDIVNISPIRWLQDPRAEYKRGSDFKKFENIRNHIDSLDVIAAKDAQDAFSIGIFSDLGIYHLTSRGGFNTKDFWKTVRTPAQVMMINKLMQLEDTVAEHIDKNMRDGIRVPVTNMGGNRGCRNVYKELAYVINGCKDGRDWTKCKNMGGYEKPENSPLPLSVKFDTVNEAQNFYNSFFTKFYTWLCNITRMLQTLNPRLLPWLGDYTHPWTDEDLYEYFNLTTEEIAAIEGEINETIR